jgi:hypothetical protein
MNNLKLAALTVYCTMLALPAVAGTSATGIRAHHRVSHWVMAVRPRGCPLHRTPLGELVDCHGWRLRDNAIGWDNSCFNLDYLPSLTACGGGGN